MGKPLPAKLLSVVATAIVLTQLSPLTLGMLVCIGNEADSGCCGEPPASASRVEEPKQFLDSSDCDCCVTVHAAPSTLGAKAHETSLDIVSGSRFFQHVVPPAGRPTGRESGHGLGESGLFSLRTVVLLI